MVVGRFKLLIFWGSHPEKEEKVTGGQSSFQLMFLGKL